MDARAIDRVLDELRATWAYRWWALAAACGLALLGWAIVFALPDRYEASARVFVDTRTALKPVLQNLTVEQDVGAQLNYVRQSLLAGPQLREIAERTGVLPAALTDPAKQDKLLQAFGARVALTVRSASGRDNDRDVAGSIYGITYTDSDRERGIRVVDTLVKVLVDRTLGGKREGSQSAQRFLEAQIGDYEKRLSDAEGRLAAFKKRNIGLMPTDQGGYFAQLQAELDNVRRLESQVSVAAARRDELTRQLRGEAAVSASAPPAAGMAAGAAAGSDTMSRIKETQARLDELLLRFTDKHPDVIATRQALAELQQRRQDEISALRRGDSDAAAASGASSNPVFQSIQVSLNQVEVEMAALRGELAQHQSKAAELRQHLDTAPQVEAEFARLNRDYDVNKAQYTALLANYEKARLGEQADDAGSVRFEVVQPPTAGFRPVFPRRGLFMAMVLAAALGAGAALAWFRQMLRPVVGSPRSLAELTGLSVIGVVGPAFPQRSSAALRGEALRFASGCVALLSAFAVALLLNAGGFRIVLFNSGVG